MKIAIGTTSSPKVAGIKDWIVSCPYFENKESIEYFLQWVPSDISEMPLNLDEIMTWARNRSRNLRKTWVEADFYIGIEWGCTTFWDKKYLGWIVYIENKAWEWHFWLSQFMEVPELVVHKLYVEWQELGPVMWELSGILQTRLEEGSMWAWSDNMLLRKAEFHIAFQAAISPFFNDYYKLK